jgi:hypothetical protein
MRIEFDAKDETELTAVFVMLAVLRGGDLSLPLLEEMTSDDSGQALPSAPPAPPVAAVAETLPPPAPPLPPTVPASGAAPVAPAGITAPAAQPPGVETDTDGLPWDNRIHSTPASKKKDGRWRGKRGLDDATRQAVTAELKQAMAAPAAGEAPVIPPPMFEEAAPGVPLPPPNGDVAVDAATAFGAGDATPVPSAPPAPPAPPVAPAPATLPPAPPATPPAAPAGPVSDFAGLMRKITGLQSAGQLTIQQTTEIAQSLGITGVRDLMHRPDLIPSFDALLPVAG